MNQLFPIYRSLILPGAVQVLLEARQSATDFLVRHQQGDWGEALDDAESRRNDEAAEQGLPILVGYIFHIGFSSCTLGKPLSSPAARPRDADGKKRKALLVTAVREKIGRLAERPARR